MQDWRGKVALITGAAAGIGFATARLLARDGATLVLLDRDAERLAEASREIAAASLISRQVDVASQAEVDAVIQSVLRECGRIDAAVLNAGIAGANVPLEEYPVTLFDEVVATNLRGAWLTLRAVVAPMKQARSGSIVLTSSIQGLAALAGTTAYTTTKHALVGMMKGAALELAGFGVRVNTIHPGYVDTPMMRTIHELVSPDDPGQFEAAIASTVPMQRYAQPEEIARLIRFLLSDESSYSTGSCFVADGGILAALPSL
jgi:NAD(P)-dependent dehydrogenase (short-subunit alcohol dehydrogenase family)